MLEHNGNSFNIFDYLNSEEESCEERFQTGNWLVLINKKYSNPNQVTIIGIQWIHHIWATVVVGSTFLDTITRLKDTMRT